MMFRPDQSLSFGVFGEERIYRIEEVAEILECDPGHVYDLIKLEKNQPGRGLVAVDIGRGRKPSYRVRHSALLRFFEQRATQPAADRVAESRPHAKRKGNHVEALTEEGANPRRNFAERYMAQRGERDKGSR